jgi:hypothetical protein
VSEPTAPSAAQDSVSPQQATPSGDLPPVADIYADVDPSVPRYGPDDPTPDPESPFGEPSDAGCES